MWPVKALRALLQALRMLADVLRLLVAAPLGARECESACKATELVNTVFGIVIDAIKQQTNAMRVRKFH